MSDRIELTKSQKAAAILVAIGKPAAGRILKYFKQDELKALIEGARQLKTIPQSELEQIVAEFEDEFAEGAGLLDSADTMDTLLTETLSTDEMNALMGGEASFTSDAAPSPWPALEALEPGEAAKLLSEEHPQTVAYIVSNLSAPAAAKVLLGLPKDLRGEVVKRMLSLKTVSAAAKRLIENQLRNRLFSAASGNSSKEGQMRVVSVLNELDKDDIDSLMADMAAAGAGDLDAIRSQLFSFEDIVNLPLKARVTLFDGISADQVTMALRGARPDLAEAVLAAIGARSRRMIESELASGADNVPAAEIVKARRTIAGTAMRMASQGVFALPSPQAAA